MKIKQLLFFATVIVCGKSSAMQTPVEVMDYREYALKQEEAKRFYEERQILRIARRLVFADRKKAKNRFEFERKQARLKRHIDLAARKRSKQAKQETFGSKPTADKMTG